MTFEIRIKTKEILELEKEVHELGMIWLSLYCSEKELLEGIDKYVEAKKKLAKLLN